MKKALLISISALMIIAVFTTIVFAATGTVTYDEGAIIRSIPSTSGEYVDSVECDETVEVLGKDGEWYKVRYEGSEGYIRGDLLSVSGEVGTVPTESAIPETTTPTETTPVVTTTNEIPSGTTNPGVLPTYDPVPVTTSYAGVGSNISLKAGINIYIIPKINGQIVATAAPNEKAEVLAEVKNWSYISTDTTYGWVKTSDISTNTAQTQTNSEQTSTRTMSVVGDSINVRSIASTDGDVLGTVSDGEAMTVTGEEGNWYQVTYNGGTGYINKDFLN